MTRVKGFKEKIKSNIFAKAVIRTTMFLITVLLVNIIEWVIIVSPSITFILLLLMENGFFPTVLEKINLMVKYVNNNNVFLSVNMLLYDNEGSSSLPYDPFKMEFIVEDAVGSKTDQRYYRSTEQTDSVFTNRALVNVKDCTLLIRNGNKNLANLIRIEKNGLFTITPLSFQKEKLTLKKQSIYSLLRLLLWFSNKRNKLELLELNFVSMVILSFVTLFCSRFAFAFQQQLLHHSTNNGFTGFTMYPLKVFASFAKQTHSYGIFFYEVIVSNNLLLVCLEWVWIFKAFMCAKRLYKNKYVLRILKKEFNFKAVVPILAYSVIYFSFFKRTFVKKIPILGLLFIDVELLQVNVDSGGFDSILCFDPVLF
jgi:hypothetical protein